MMKNNVLPIQDWFFWLNWKKSVALYWSIFTFDVIVLILHPIIHTAVNTMIIFFINFATNQTELICFRISKLKGPLYHINLLSNIKHQQKVNLFVSEVQELFSPILFANLSIIAFILCNICYKISTVSNLLKMCVLLSLNYYLICFFKKLSVIQAPIEVIFSIFFLCLILIQLLLPCFAGQELITQSQNVGRSFYNSNWLEASKKDRHIILFGIRKSIQPSSFEALHWFKLHLPTVTAVKMIFI